MRYDLDATDSELPMSLFLNVLLEAVITVGDRSRRLSAAELEALASAAAEMASYVTSEEEA